MVELGQISGDISLGSNINYQFRENEAGKALFRERTNCNFNDPYRFVFVSKIN